MLASLSCTQILVIVAGVWLPRKFLFSSLDIFEHFVLCKSVTTMRLNLSYGSDCVL